MGMTTFHSAHSDVQHWDRLVYNNKGCSSDLLILFVQAEPFAVGYLRLTFH